MRDKVHSTLWACGAIKDSVVPLLTQDFQTLLVSLSVRADRWRVAYCWGWFKILAIKINELYHSHSHQMKYNNNGDHLTSRNHSYAQMISDLLGMASLIHVPWGWTVLTLKIPYVVQKVNIYWWTRNILFVMIFRRCLACIMFSVSVAHSAWCGFIVWQMWFMYILNVQMQCVKNNLSSKQKGIIVIILMCRLTHCMKQGCIQAVGLRQCVQDTAR